MNFIADVGNSSTKIAVIEENKILAREEYEHPTDSDFDALFARFPLIDKAIVSSSGADGERVFSMVEGRVNYILRMTPSTPVPLRNEYSTPETLGTDRLAAAVGAKMLYGADNMLIVDFGTAITYDLVVDGAFVGGNISLGLYGRLRALHEYTSSLPHCLPTDEKLLCGNSTRTAVEQGVMSGIEYETEGYIEKLSKKYVNLCIIFTGGDSKYFVKRIKNTIFANRDLTLFGLHGILEYNANKEKDI